MAKTKIHTEVSGDSKDAQRALKGFQNSIGKAEKSTKSMMGSFVKMGAAIGAGLIVFKAASAAITGVKNQIVGTIKDTAKLGDQFAKMSKQVGISVESLSALKYAAEISGSSFEGMTRGLKLLSKNIIDMSRNMGEAKEDFKALGISVTGAGGQLKSTEQVLAEIADRFKTMPDGVEKTAAAVRIFGRSGMELIPMLNEGSSGIQALMTRAKQLGVVMDTKTAKAAEDFNDRITDLKAGITGVKWAIAKDLMPEITKIVVKMGDWISANKDLIKVNIKAWIEAIRNAAEKLWPLLQRMAKGAAKIGDLLDIRVNEKLKDDLEDLNKTLDGANERLRASKKHLNDQMRKGKSWFESELSHQTQVKFLQEEYNKDYERVLGMMRQRTALERELNTLKEEGLTIEEPPPVLIPVKVVTPEAAAGPGISEEMLAKLIGLSPEAIEAFQIPGTLLPTLIQKLTEEMAATKGEMAIDLAPILGMTPEQVEAMPMDFLEPLYAKLTEAIREYQESLDPADSPLSILLGLDPEIIEGWELPEEAMEVLNAKINEGIMEQEEALRERILRITGLHPDILASIDLAGLTAINAKIRKEQERTASQVAQSWSSNLGMIGQIFANVSQVVGKENKKMAKAMKVISIAQALINTYVGFTKALAEGGIMGIVTGAIVLAAGLAQVAAIAAQKVHTGGYIEKAHEGGMNLASDEVPVIAQTGEGMLNREATEAVGGKAGIDALNAGGGAGGGDITINISGNLIAEDEWIEDKLIPALSEGLGDRDLGVSLGLGK